MKRIICILIILINCVCSTAISETHIGIQGTVVSGKNNKTVLFDLFWDNDRTIAMTSSLTSDYVIRDSDELQNAYSIVNMIFDITPESIALLTARLHGIYRDWLETRYTERSEGIYTGPLFGKATSVCVTEYMLSDITQFMKNQYLPSVEYENKKQSNTEYCDMLLECFICGAERLSAAYNPLVRMKSYDSDRYIIFDLMKQDQVILTLSVDNTVENEKRVLITQKENNLYFFRDIYAQYDRSKCVLSTKLYCDKGSFYENVSQDDFLICEHFTLTESGQQRSISYDCENKKEEKILSVTGGVTFDQVNISIFIQDSESENIIITASRDTQTPGITSDTVKEPDAYHEADSNEYSIAFMSGLSLFLAEAVPMLPVSGQKIIYQMLFNQ